jgi:hypothetical protein
VGGWMSGPKMSHTVTFHCMTLCMVPDSYRDVNIKSEIMMYNVIFAVLGYTMEFWNT